MSIDIDADEWVNLALLEYEQVANLSNAQSLLGNAAISMSTTSIALPSSLNNPSEFPVNSGVDSRSIEATIQRQNLYDKVSDYYESINALRKTHALLKKKLLASSSQQRGLKADERQEGSNITLRRRPPLVQEAFTRHLELSERVIRTIMQSSKQNNGPCGVLFENGIVRTSSTRDHEVNVVALASLRASVSKLRVDFVGS
mmetsp:Transcript_27459/g.56230  ORF Transcript_27459/g.56230 Transcript_27459/m.56230 type:complete len:201 (+) Transcript_27459:57-659(+)